MAGVHFNMISNRPSILDWLLPWRARRIIMDLQAIEELPEVVPIKNNANDEATVLFLRQQFEAYKLQFDSTLETLQAEKAEAQRQAKSALTFIKIRHGLNNLPNVPMNVPIER